MESMSAFSSKYGQIRIRNYSSQMFLMISESQKNSGGCLSSVSSLWGSVSKGNLPGKGTVIVEKEKRHGKKEKDSARSMLIRWWAESVKMRKF